MTTPAAPPSRSLFASVQLALLLLFLLASVSIIGTLIPQNNPPGFYIDRYGANTARLFHILDLTDMYNSWWFLSLLGLFAVNLTVCSLERIPQVVRLLRRDPMAIKPDQLAKQPCTRTVDLTTPVAVSATRMTAHLAGKDWKAKAVERDGGYLLFAEKGGWTRFGVYVVHCSILLILAGALIGSSAVATKVLRQPTFAFKGSAMIPEGETIDHIQTFKSGRRIDLGFSLRCEDFRIEFYANGMPKTYRSTVTVLEEGKPVRSTDIEVNRPLTHRGVTFYQSSYQPLPQYELTLHKRPDELKRSFIAPAAQEVAWPEAGVSFGILNRETQGEVTRKLKIWLTDNQGEPSVLWVDADQEATIERPSGAYRIQARQLYATGLQATKDPGVWLVYLGCLLMLVGLYIAFFLSHRRMYVLIQPQANGSRLLLAGTANKNKVGFEKKFMELTTGLN